jgi:RNA methyltransferase, TrmH family
MLEITSHTNALFKKFLSLTEAKGLKKEGLFLLSGKNLVSEFVKNPTLEIESEIWMEGQTPLLPSKAQVKLSKVLFEAIDVLGTKSTVLVLRQPELPDWDFSKMPKGLILLTPLGDPSNLGALLRSSEAFGVKNVVLLKESSHPFLPKAVKASAGSATRLKLWKGPFIKDLNAHPVVALDLKGTAIAQFQWPQNGYLLIGEEGAGVPEIPRLQRLSIPTENVESLNATVAASIALFDWKNKQSKSV